MKIKTSKQVEPIYLIPGDKVILSHTDELGKEHELLSDDITQAMVVDTVAVLELKNELGFKSAIAGVFGESDDTKDLPSGE